MNIDSVKAGIGILAIILTFAGYVPYTKDIIAGKTKPHLYSWFLWLLVTSVVFGIQYTSGAGMGGFVTLAAVLMCILVIILSFRHGVNRDVKPIDAIFIFLAIIAMLIWLVAKQPVLSAIFSTLIDILGFAPTIRKSWNNPHSETLSFYFLNSFRFALATIALSNYTITTALYPISWLLANGLFAVMLLYRRKVVK